MEKTKTTPITVEHIKGKEIPPSWIREGKVNPEESFRVILEPEPVVSSEKRNRLLDLLESSTGEEDSEKWIKKIKSAKTRSELKVPME